MEGDYLAIKILTASFTGIEGYIISVEIDICKGLPCFNIVGLADVSVKESKERVRSAILNSGFEFPLGRITVNLAPADIRKEGSQYDLPIAIGILIASEQIIFNEIDSYLFMGELSLSGDLKKVKGALPLVIEGVKNSINNYIVPLSNVKECCIIKDSNIYPFSTLKQVVSYLICKDMLPFIGSYENTNRSQYNNLDFSDIIGQESSKRAIEVAAAGGHNIIMAGPPGSGKTMLAQRIPTILPSLNYDEALEVTKIYSVSGNLNTPDGLIYERPFRSPHHTTSNITLVGGGLKLMPGEISLAHNGVLFLDEILEFKKNVLEVLRQPLEDRKITISRTTGSVLYPANFMLTASLNPCPCGYYGSNLKACTCSDYARKKYLSKLSGPFLDRIDIFLFVNPIPYSDLSNKKKSETSKEIKSRVEKARDIQKCRFRGKALYCNAQMNQNLIDKYCNLNTSTKKLIKNIYTKFNLSTRAYSRILKVSRTIADLRGSESIEEVDVIEAIQYRKFLNENIL